jgi:RimJ/RimL family protein N-acetyltransferase
VADPEPTTDPPYRIHTERLVLRCWNPADAPLFAKAIGSSLEHLRPWMPWAQTEPHELPERVALLRRFRGEFDLGRDFHYGIFGAGEEEVVGGAGLHPRVGEDAYAIGYWIRADCVRQGLATEAAAALTHVAFAVCGVERVEIHVDSANIASLAVPRKLGFVEEATLRRRLLSFPETRRTGDLTVFSLLADDAAAQRLSALILEAYDAGGARLL